MKRTFPHLPVLGVLLAAWLALFHFLGNSSFGYIDTRSLFVWLSAVYEANADDALGYAIPPLIVLLIWTRREEFGALPKRVWLPAVGLLGVAVALHAVGYLVQQARLSLAGLCLGVYALTGVVWGPQWLRRAAYPFALLIFTVPLTAYTDSLTFPLRLLATQVASGFCTGVLGLDLIRKGTEVFHALPDGTTGFQFDVAPACSGIRSLTVVLLLTLVFGYLNLRSAPRRLVLALAAVPLALLGNVVRLIVVFFVGAKYGQEAGVRIETKLGFLTFLVALGGVMLLARWLREPAPAPSAQAAAGPPVEARSPGFATWAAVLGLVALTIGLGALTVGTISSRQRLGRPAVAISRIPLIGDEGRLVRSNSVALPTLVPGYSYQPVPVSALELNYLPGDTTFGRGRYTDRNGSGTQVSVVLMGTDRTSIHRPEYCLTGQGWRITSQRLAEVPLRSQPGRTLAVQRFDAQFATTAKGQREEMGGVYVFWFVAEGQQTASHWQRQWWMIRDLVTKGVLQRWAYISFFSPCPPGKEDEAFARVAQLIDATAPHFQQTGNVASR